ncbi:LysM peptidoglycan-binding domain-containing protein [Williamwhitmania taraxaci]|uniref:LysM domain-containing protein n=1 Tax=Williamwhitmania taraxaci TaxID=1640674 RepID=A0A1G6MAF6_9BACT|nr:LysM peptidoglycan-binding domain-containing protein [Williamwhitmania taraxaci]SDC52317.1 hypothetical protein SAMN05216323_103513 [Williamwhitmania taraxaci]
MNAVRVEPGQNLLDLAVQHYGTVEQVLSLALANGLSPTQALVAGEEVSVGLPVNRAVASLYAVNGIKPATAITQAEELQTISDEGVEFWAIEEDFIIS